MAALRRGRSVSGVLGPGPYFGLQLADPSGGPSVRAEKTIRKAVDLGVHSIWLTVDAPVVSGGAARTYVKNVEGAHLCAT
jgi:hypothetical protein